LTGGSKVNSSTVVIRNAYEVVTRLAQPRSRGQCDIRLSTNHKRWRFVD